LLEETVQACLRMWHGELGDQRPFLGKHVSMARPLNAPQSLSHPHPPILIAGGGERRTLPLVAKYGDACNIPPSPELPEKLELLKRLCDQSGRDYGAIEKTAPFAFDVGTDGSKVPGAARSVALARLARRPDGIRLGGWRRRHTAH